MSGTAEETNFDYEQSYAVSNASEDETSVPTLSDGRSEHRTGFDPSDVPSHKREMVYRDDQWMPKWQWFNLLQNGYYNRNEKLQKDAHIGRDVDSICTSLDLPYWINEESTETLIQVRDNKTGGLSFGPKLTVGITVLGAINLVCRRESGIATREEAKTSINPIEKAAHTTDEFLDVGEMIVDKDTVVNREKIRDARYHIQDAIN